MHFYQQWKKVLVDPHPHQHLVLPVFWIFGHFNRCAPGSCCYFNLPFPDDIKRGASFSMPTCHLYSFFGEVFVQLFDSFFKLGCLFSYSWVLEVFLYILNNSPLWDVPLVNIFSQSVVCHLVLRMVSFTGQKFFILIKSSLLIIS